MKLRIIGVMGTVIAALLVTSLPTLAADGVQSAEEGRLYGGAAKESSKWINLDEPSGWGAGDGRSVEYLYEDATYKLTLQARRRDGAKSGCSAIAYVMQWNSDEREWVSILERSLRTWSYSTKKVSASAGSYEFRLGGQPAFLGLNTNGYCKGANMTLSSRLPWSYVE